MSINFTKPRKKVILVQTNLDKAVNSHDRHIGFSFCVIDQVQVHHFFDFEDRHLHTRQYVGEQWRHIVSHGHIRNNLLHDNSLCRMLWVLFVAIELGPQLLNFACPRLLKEGGSLELQCPTFYVGARKKGSTSRGICDRTELIIRHYRHSPKKKKKRPTMSCFWRGCEAQIGAHPYRFQPHPPFPSATKWRIDIPY